MFYLKYVKKYVLILTLVMLKYMMFLKHATSYKLSINSHTSEPAATHGHPYLVLYHCLERKNIKDAN